MYRVYTMRTGWKIQVGQCQSSEKKAREIVKRKERFGVYCFIEKVSE